MIPHITSGFGIRRPIVSWGQILWKGWLNEPLQKSDLAMVEGTSILHKRFVHFVIECESIGSALFQV